LFTYSPLLWEVLSCSFQTQIKVCKKTIGLSTEGLPISFEPLGLKVMDGRVNASSVKSFSVLLTNLSTLIRKICPTRFRDHQPFGWFKAIVHNYNTNAKFVGFWWFHHPQLFCIHHHHGFIRQLHIEQKSSNIFIAHTFQKTSQSVVSWQIWFPYLAITIWILGHVQITQHTIACRSLTIKFKHLWHKLLCDTQLG
jgi:hypothetical protein